MNKFDIKYLFDWNLLLKNLFIEEQNYNFGYCPQKIKKSIEG